MARLLNNDIFLSVMIYCYFLMIILFIYGLTGIALHPTNHAQWCADPTVQRMELEVPKAIRAC